VLLQLQTMRMRCEKKRQKDATQQQAELTAEQIAERKAKADAFAEVTHSTLLLLHFIVHFEDSTNSQSSCSLQRCMILPRWSIIMDVAEPLDVGFCGGVSQLLL